MFSRVDRIARADRSEFWTRWNAASPSSKCNPPSICAKSRGIQTGMFLMWGYEGEELDDIEATIEHVKRTDPDVFFTTVSYPIKGTPYYARNSNSLVQLKPWRQSSDRELSLRGRHSPEFYGFVDRLLQSEVQLARLQRAGIDEAAQKDCGSR